ncbi:hypothetical protein BU15DRAFT_75907 [Melanogaster broomeanus]|nr:hypothetical protein BU15DRAFT_75907 [Melanogaster broomeanus]
MQRLIDQPLNFSSHIRWMSGSLILAISHGYESQMEADSYLHTAETAIQFFATTSVIGGSIVDIVPILRYLPSWFPGASFWKTATDGKKALDEMADKPHEVAKAEMFHIFYDAEWSADSTSTQRKRQFNFRHHNR